MIKFLKSKKGFTLVELMVVVVILGILAAIAIPLFANGADDARDSADKTTASTLNGAVAMYMASEADTSVLTDATTTADALAELVTKGYIQDTSADVTNIDFTGGTKPTFKVK